MSQLVGSTFLNQLHFAGARNHVYENDLWRTYGGVVYAQTNVGPKGKVRSKGRTLYRVRSIIKKMNAVGSFVPNTLHRNFTTLYNEGMNARITEFTPKHLAANMPMKALGTFDFTGMLRRAGQGLAFLAATEDKDSTHVHLRVEHLAAGKKIAFTEASTLMTGLGRPGSVYINMDSVNASCPHTATVLAALATAFDVTVHTDRVFAASSGHVSLPLPRGRFFIEGLVDAVKYMLGFYNEAGDGVIGLLALIAGMNDIATVYGHCDEAGIFRDVLKAIPIAVPYGVLSGVFSPSCRLPLAAVGGVQDNLHVRSFVDAMLLTTAALVGLCDPGMQYDGKRTNTVWVSNAVTDAEIIHAQRSNLDRDGPAMFRIYLNKLATLSGCSMLDVNTAVMFLEQSLHTMARTQKRHFKEQVIAPWFWVEPAHILAEAPASVLDDELCPLNCVGYDKKVSLPMFDDVHQAYDSMNGRTQVTVRWTGMRRCGLYYIYNTNARSVGTMAQIRVVKSACDIGGLSDSLICPGSGTITDLESMCWLKGDIVIPHPSEAAAPATLFLTMHMYHPDLLDPVSEWSAMPNANAVKENMVDISIGRIQATNPKDIKTTTCWRKPNKVTQALRMSLVSQMKEYSPEALGAADFLRAYKNNTTTIRAIIEVQGEDTTPLSGKLESNPHVPMPGYNDVNPHRVQPADMEVRSTAYKHPGRPAGEAISINEASGTKGSEKAGNSGNATSDVYTMPTQATPKTLGNFVAGKNRPNVITQNVADQGSIKSNTLPVLDVHLPSFGVEPAAVHGSTDNTQDNNFIDVGSFLGLGTVTALDSGGGGGDAPPPPSI